jgi:acyl-coenzyme A synthetase/AMP-(fatty) acid ligase
MLDSIGDRIDTTQDIGHRLPDAWIRPPILPVDHLGPVDRPFRPFPVEALETPIIDLLHQVVRRIPYAIAVQEPRDTVLFAELWASVCHLTRRIQEHPSNAGVIGILLPPSAAQLVAVFACLAAGRVCAMLEVSHPWERNAQLARLAGVKLVLVAEGAVPGLAGVPNLQVPPFGERAPAPPLPEFRLGSDAPAFILFTSGSTGVPKAIVHSQRTLLHMARNSINSMHINEHDRGLSIGSFSTLGGFQPWLRLTLVGASVQMLDFVAGGFRALLRTLEAAPVTILRASPSTLRTLVQLPGVAAALSGLRIIHTSGEPLLKTDMAALRAVLPPGCLIRHNYGSTEAHGVGGFAQLEDGQDPVRVASGWLVPGCQALILDADGRPCAPGEAGELIFRSRYAALGEWVDGKVVPGRLKPDPDDPTMRIYQTGDLVRMGRDGMVVILGRKDRMLKLNGQRLEPGEIEAVLRAVAGVEHAAVVARPALLDTPALLRAFVVPSRRAGPGLAAGIRETLRARLPAYMVPSRLTLLDAMPLLPSGKLDEAALLAME